MRYDVMVTNVLPLINKFLAVRLNASALAFTCAAQAEIAAGAPDARVTALLSLASRYAPRQALAPSAVDIEQAGKHLTGWNPQAWSMLDTMRVALLLSHPDQTKADFAERFNRWFTYADEGELCAFYRVIPLLPESQRFVWRAAEGCRTNMKTVFMAVACDSPFPQQYFDDIAWQQLIVKALFTETPLPRVYGLDQRLSTTLSLMVLDYMEERSSAGRDIPLDAWLCLGVCNDCRINNFIQQALSSSNMAQRCAAIIALGRAQQHERLQQLLHENTDSRLQAVIQQVIQGRTDQHAFHEFTSELEG